MVELSAEDFKSCSQIKTLILKNNPIQRFSGTTFLHMKKIGRIILSKNTASCWTTDDLQSLLQLKTKTKFKLEIVDWFRRKKTLFFNFAKRNIKSWWRKNLYIDNQISNIRKNYKNLPLKHRLLLKIRIELINLDKSLFKRINRKKNCQYVQISTIASDSAI